jgi:hypothetical protein
MTEDVLILAGAVLTVGVDEEDVALTVAALAVRLAQDQDAARDAGAVEEIRAEADDRLDAVVLQQFPADVAFLATPEQHAVRHDSGGDAVVFQHGDHVLDEHQVGLLALLRHPDGEAAGILGVLLDVVLAEQRIGEHTVVALQLVALVLVLRPADSVFLADVRVGDAVQQHVHFAD